MIRVLEMESSKGWGGQEKRTVRLVNALDKTRFKVFYAVQPDSKLLSKADEIDATMLPVAMRQSYDLKALRKLVGHIRREKIDLISTHSGKDAWLGALAGRLTGTPVVRVRHLSTPVKSVLSYNLSDRVVTVSQQVYDYLLHRGVAREKLRLIYTGIDTERFRPGHGLDLHRTFGIPEGKLVVGIVAVLRGAKRHLDLLEAIRPLPEIAVLIVGNGPQESKIRRAIEEMGLEDRVAMAGHREDIHRILPALDLFVLPSRMEALGTAILEASACAVPVLGSNVGGIPECVLDGKTGYLFEKENPEELRHKLKLLIDHPKRRREMGEAGRKMVEERFSTERMVRETETLYRELTDD